MDCPIYKVQSLVEHHLNIYSARFCYSTSVQMSSKVLIGSPPLIHGFIYISRTLLRNGRRNQIQISASQPNAGRNRAESLKRRRRTSGFFTCILDTKLSGCLERRSSLLSARVRKREIIPPLSYKSLAFVITDLTQKQPASQPTYNSEEHRQPRRKTRPPFSLNR